MGLKKKGGFALRDNRDNRLTHTGITIAHITASPSYGGSERQMLGLGQELQDVCNSVFISFLEEGRCWDFVKKARSDAFEAYALKYDTPRLVAALRELMGLLRNVNARLVCCHGYKPNLLGLLAARQLRIPAIAVSHGWTGESLRVRLFDALDRRVLRWMDKVVCVSEGQAKKVRYSGVADTKVQVIRDAVRTDRFTNVDRENRHRLESMFPERPSLIVGAAGRLSPEKGFKHLVDAAASVLRDFPSAGFVLFGDGPLREPLCRQIAAKGLADKFILAGFHSDLDYFFPHLDLLVQSSFTEGLPNVVLEAYAAGAPVVATAVGGTPEIIEDGVSGYLVESGDSAALAGRIARMLSDDAQRRAMGLHGQKVVKERFSFSSQMREYERLFDSLLSTNGKAQS